MAEKIRVLIVDDEESFWKPMSQHLQKDGFEINVATTAQEALSKIQACNGDIQVAVIDQIMGPPNGIETMLLIRQYFPATESIILTGWGDMEPGEKAMELGAYRYMNKPVKPKELALDIRCAARFGQERQKGLALQNLVSGGQKIGAVQNENELYQQLYEEAKKLLPNLDGFLVSRFEEKDQLISFPYGCIKGCQVSVPDRKSGNRVTEYVIQKKEPVLLTFGDRDFREKNKLDAPDPNLGFCESEISVPMFLDNRVFGTLNALTFDPGTHYTKDHLQVLQAFANQAAVAIRNVQQLNEAEELRAAASALASKRGKDAVLRAIVEEAHKLILSDFTGLILQDDDGTIHKIKPVIPEHFFEKFWEPRQEGGVTQFVIKNQQPRVIPDTSIDPLVKESVRAEGIQSMLVLPLISGNRVLGVLYAHTLASRHFSSHDVNLWEAFATQAAEALDRALEQEKEINDFLRLADGLGTLADKMDLDETLEKIPTAAKHVFLADTCRLAYIDPGTRQIINWSWADGDPEEFRFEGEPRPTGVTLQVIRTQEPEICSRDDVEKAPIELINRGLKSFATLPLVVEKRTIGVMHCNYLTREEDFSERLKTLMHAFGVRAAVALNRAHRNHISAIWRRLDQQAVSCQNPLDLYKLFTKYAREAMKADFAVFYPFDLTAPNGKLVPLEEDVAIVGELNTLWEQQNGGPSGGIYQSIQKSLDGFLIVNDLENDDKKYQSALATREAVKAFIALRLDVKPIGEFDSQIAGMLFLNYRSRTYFEPSDLTELLHAGNLIASSILRLSLQSDIQKTSERHTNQLRAFLQIFEQFRRDGNRIDLNTIAQQLVNAFSIDACTLVEFKPDKMRFSDRGTAGLMYPDKHYSLPSEYRDLFKISSDFIEILDVRNHPLMMNSKFVEREKIKSVLIYPLQVDDQNLGLLFASFRSRVNLPNDEKVAIGLFASLAALFLHQEHLGQELNETHKRLNRRFLLDWLSMIEATWRHSLVQKSSAIQNYATYLKKRLEKFDILPSEMEGIPETINEIDLLASEISNAPPRVPQSWEMKREKFTLGPILKTVVAREKKLAMLNLGPETNIRIEDDEIKNVKVWGFKRWLIYAMEALLQNSRNSMPNGGKVVISGTCKDKWVEIRVKDSGKGIPQKIRERIFEELIPREEDEEGMGIGSLLTATIIEEHDGKINIEKTSSRGTTILICLPKAAEDN